MHQELPKHLHAQFRVGTTLTQTLVLITIRDYYTLREMYGQSFVDLLEKELKQSLTQTAAKNRTKQTHIQHVGPGITAFLVPQDNNPADTAYEYKIQAQNDMERTMLRHTGLGIDLGMGFALIPHTKTDSFDTLIVHALQEARRMESRPLNMNELSITSRFNTILTQGWVTAHYQPILDFRSDTILGWEALARGPEGSSFRSPVMLFETAEELGRLFALEKLCREAAISNVGKLTEGQKLFLNIHPKTMGDPSFTPGNTMRLMEQANLTPDNIVFEITEQHSVQDFDLFYRTLEHYRSQGFQIAVDDAGAGYAGLALIAELQPDYIKIDKSLIIDIHKDPVKRALVETTATFADKIGSRIIGEGIECKDQALCLKDIGVHCGQGFFLAKPAAPKPSVSPDCLDLRPISDFSNAITCSQPVGEIAQAPHAVEPDFLVSQAQNFFKKNNTFSNIVVTQKNLPKGLIMEYQLNRQLSSQYGIALYHKRSVESIMDDNPLVVDFDTPVEQAAHTAMKREPFKAYDDIIVTRKGLLYGVVTVQCLLNALAKIQVEMAKGTNPLTGLPGNVAIEQEVENRIKQHKSFSIIYGDLDHFKVFNDTYGFKNGDRIIKLAADIMSWATRKHAPKEARLCHIGGDDFVLITTADSVPKICKSIARCFGRLVNNCYCAEDRERGWIKAKGRDGKERNYPLVTISLGVIEIFGKCSLMEIGERAAHIKKYAKSIPGNSVAIDRRPAVGSEELIQSKNKRP
ncbi:GGDEF domain-containing protein [Pseudodesulfovibrio sediminis]|uniref:Diguanylate phosphodiesterase n=1 Tax=Pseudodesulfovibrio sediminis TaxID=2810563 RepID=A0ABN6ER22_9BACT|nr:bifunctional diguanylate cyclase/phosphodiesterase [Pseudodesulfovibrio sediminis]BCS87268.1 diguanylate phosphodiesterase [Pseudodesulfovibrio sediminis]